MGIEGIFSVGASAVAILAGIAALILWVIKSTVAPLRVVIENNTRVMERIEAKLDEHADVLDDHGNRLTRIETKHSVRHGEE